MNRKGFTLIELLVVVAIIGILAAVGVVAYNGYTASAKKAVVKTNLKQIEKYINNEMMKCITGIEMEAYEKGADFIVVGRPITKSEDPRKALELFL